MVFGAQRKPILERRHTPAEESNGDQGAVAAFGKGLEGELLGRLKREGASGTAGSAGGGVPEARRSVLVPGCLDHFQH